MSAPDEQTVERVAKAIWDEIRELEDRCDMEWDDMPSDHVHFVAARAAIEAMPDTKALEAARVLYRRACELVHHELECPAIGGRGDEDCACDAVPFLNDLRALSGDKP